MVQESMDPRNLRQIGEIQDGKRIYLEDYVMSFVRKEMHGMKTAGEWKVGILTGCLKETDGLEVICKGALLTDEECEEEEKWKKLEQEKNQYFPDQQMIGCFVLGEAEEQAVQALLVHSRMKRAVILRVQDGGETVFCSDEEQCEQLKGFFIFYEQNPQMQKYMSETCEQKSVEQEEGSKSEAVACFREKVKKNDSSRKKGSMRYLAGSFLILVILALGATIINNYDRLKLIEKTIEELDEQQQQEKIRIAAASAAAELSRQQAENEAENTGVFWNQDEGESEDAYQNSHETAGTAEDGNRNESLSGAVNGTGETLPENSEKETNAAAEASGDKQTGVKQAEAASATAAERVYKEEQNYSAENPDMIQPAEKEEQPLYQDEALASVNARAQQAFYTVKYGDTLADISQRYYGSLEFVEKICEVNQIRDANMIIPGQKIVLP